ncbi:MAG: hypothetical protein V1646_00145 [bacterium]
MSLNKFMDKLRIIFYIPLTAFLFCIKSAMPMATSVINAEQVNHIRQTLLECLIIESKSKIISCIDLDEEIQADVKTGDIFLSYDQYELIGTKSGHLQVIVVKGSQKSVEIIKVHNGAVSCITAEGNIVATASSTCLDAIHRWNIGTSDISGKLEIKMHDKISCKMPIIFMHTIKNHFFTVDIKGHITLLDWQTGIPLCHIETGISEPILNTVINTKKGFIIIMSSKSEIIININSLIELDTIICSLNEAQLAQIYQIMTSDIHGKDYTKSVDCVKLPYKIRALLTDLPKTMPHKI